MSFRTRKKRERSGITRNYRTTALIDVAVSSPQSRERLAEELDKAVYEATAQYPSVTHYFVKLVDSNIIVGLQLEKVLPQNVQNIVTALVDDSLDATKRALELRAPVEVAESELYLV